MEQLNEYTDEKTVKVLVGGKVDHHDDRRIRVEECAEMALKHELDYFEISSKTGYNVNSAFDSLVERYFEGRQ